MVRATHVWVPRCVPVDRVIVPTTARGWSCRGDPNRKSSRRATSRPRTTASTETLPERVINKNGFSTTRRSAKARFVPLEWRAQGSALQSHMVARLLSIEAVDLKHRGDGEDGDSKLLLTRVAAEGIRSYIKQRRHYARLLRTKAAALAARLLADGKDTLDGEDEAADEDEEEDEANGTRARAQ